MNQNGAVYSMMIFIFIVVAFVALNRGYLADKSLAVRTAEAQGYSNIEIIDHSWFAVGLRGCDRNDAARFTIQAVNPVGKQAQIYVCTGLLFKGGTIRVQ